MKLSAGTIVTAVVVLGLIAGSALMFLGGNGALTVAPEPAPTAAAPAAEQSGLQTLEITAKGGYSPAASNMNADVPGLLRVVTQSTFDCSSSLVIPQLNYRAHLPMTGTTEIAIPPQPAGTTITGLCGMGMYSFTIRFG